MIRAHLVDGSTIDLPDDAMTTPARDYYGVLRWSSVAGTAADALVCELNGDEGQWVALTFADGRIELVNTAHVVRITTV